MKKILHLATDDKFIDFAIEEFNSVDLVNNVFIVLSTYEHVKQLKYVKNLNEVEIKSENELLNNDFIVSLPEYSGVILHTLHTTFVHLILLSEYTNFVWMSWGYDFYEYHPKLNRKLLLPHTKKLKLSIEKESNKTNLHKLLIKLKLRKGYWELQEEALKKVRFISTVIHDDFLIIKNIYKNTEHIEYLEFSYGDIDVYGSRYGISGENILLGNSATFSNNHIEAIDILREKNLSNKKVITPLSYGSEVYGRHIVEYGIKNLSSSFLPLLDYMQIDEYMNLISSCGYVVMNHMRQQAMGNIYKMLSSGAKIFLRTENPVYSFLLREGFIVYSIDELREETPFIPLSEKEKMLNNTLVNNLLSKEKVINEVKIFINTILRFSS